MNFGTINLDFGWYSSAKKECQARLDTLTVRRDEMTKAFELIRVELARKEREMLAIFDGEAQAIKKTFRATMEAFEVELQQAAACVRAGGSVSRFAAASPPTLRDVTTFVGAQSNLHARLGIDAEVVKEMLSMTLFPLTSKPGGTKSAETCFQLWNTISSFVTKKTESAKTERNTALFFRLTKPRKFAPFKGAWHQKLTYVSGFFGGLKNLTISKDGCTCAVLRGNTFLVQDFYKVTTVGSFQFGNSTDRLPGLCFLPRASGENSLLYAGERGLLELDTRTGTVVREISSFGDFMCVDADADGYVIVAGKAQKICVFDAAHDVLKLEIEIGHGTCCDLAVFPDAASVAIATGLQHVGIVSLVTGQELTRITCSDFLDVRTVNVMSDDELIVGSCDCNVVLVTGMSAFEPVICGKFEFGKGIHSITSALRRVFILHCLEDNRIDIYV